MLEFDSTAPSDPEGLAALARQGRWRAISAAPKSALKSPEILAFPRWARLADVSAGNNAETAF
jgi:hypothetical protein